MLWLFTPAVLRGLNTLFTQVQKVREMKALRAIFFKVFPKSVKRISGQRPYGKQVTELTNKLL